MPLLMEHAVVLFWIGFLTVKLSAVIYVKIKGIQNVLKVIYIYIYHSVCVCERERGCFSLTHTHSLSLFLAHFTLSLFLSHTQILCVSHSNILNNLPQNTTYHFHTLERHFTQNRVCEIA